MRLYIDPRTRKYVERLPTLKELEAWATKTVSEEEYSLSRRASKWGLAVSLWQLYERSCEEFDRLVCSSQTQCREGMVAMPQDAIEQAEVSCNAKLETFKLMLRAGRLSIPLEIMERAKHAQERWEWEQP